MRDMKKIGLSLLIVLLTLAFNIRLVNASIILIDYNGQVQPSTAREKIQQDDDVYTFTDNIYCDGIEVQKGHITIDGSGYTLHGPGNNSGTCGFHIISSYDVNDVTIQGTTIENFECGIRLGCYTNNNKIRRNTIADCRTGVKVGGIEPPLQYSANNEFYQNNFMFNCEHVSWDSFEGYPSTSHPYNKWDANYPAGGNYWSNYAAEDDSVDGGPNAGDSKEDGIGDDEYVIDDNNIDRFPLTRPYMLSVRNIEKESGYYTIQEAINDANPGDTIRVLSGVYYQGGFFEQRYYEYDDPNVKSVDVNKSVWLVGAGNSKPVIDAIRNGGDVVKISADHTHIEGFAIQNAADANCGIDMNAVKFNHIINNMITGGPNNTGIELYNSSNYNTLVGNEIIDNNSGGIGINDCNNIFVSKNEIESSSDDFGIVINNSDKTRLIGNTLASNKGGISVEGNSRNNEIRRNDISSNVGDSNGIVVQVVGDANTMVASNTVSSSYNGIVLSGTSGNRIFKNTLESNKYGLCLNNAPNNVIEKNVVKSNSYGGIVLLGSSDDVSITENIIYDNNSPDADANGIYLADSCNVSITKNKIWGNTYNGIILNDSPYCQIFRNRLSSNQIGINLQNKCHHTTISKNRMKENTDCGIYISNDCNENTIYHNVFLDNVNNAQDDDEGIGNKWHGGYYRCDPNDPNVGGNFWSDYNAEDKVKHDPCDEYHGEYQNQEGSDWPDCTKYGIADQPYPINSSDVNDVNDRYPLILAACKIVADPLKPEMKKSYILDINMVNCAGDLAEGADNEPPDCNIYFAGANQVDARPGPWLDWVPYLPESTPGWAGWFGIGNWELNPNIQARCIPGKSDQAIEPNEAKRFRLRFRNRWDWIKPNDWAGVTTSLICAIHKIPTKITAGVSIFRLIWACYDACRAVPSMTYTFKPLRTEDCNSSDIIIFSKDVSVEVPEEKLLCLGASLGTQVLSIGCAICAYILSSNPLTVSAAPPFWIASALYTIESIAFYYVAEDPDPNYMEIFQSHSVNIGTDVNLYSAGIRAGTVEERLVLAALEMACLDQAYGESYIRYDYAKAADPNALIDPNDPNYFNDPDYYYMGLQLAAAVKYNGMAIRKLQEVQLLTAALTEDPYVNTAIKKITDANVNEFRAICDVNWNDIGVGVTDPNDPNMFITVEKDILEVFDFNNPNNPNDPNRPSNDDVKNVILVATDPAPSDPNMVVGVAALRELYKDPNNLFKFGHAIIESHYLQNCALEAAKEANNLEFQNGFDAAVANDVAITDVWPSVDEVYLGGKVTINVELENFGNSNATTDVNVYIYVDDINDANILGPQAVSDLDAGAKMVLTFMWDTNDIDEATLPLDGCTYKIKVEAATLVGEVFIFDNVYIGVTVEVWPIPAAPDVPTLLQSTHKTHKTVGLAWTASSGDVNGYKVYRDGYYVGWSDDVFCMDTGLIPCTTYNYTVSACSDTDESGRSNEVTVTTSRNADINSDRHVDNNDLFIMAENWLEQDITGDSPGDYGDIYCDCNGSDRKVDFFDFAVLAGRWCDDCN